MFRPFERDVESQHEVSKEKMNSDASRWPEKPFVGQPEVVMPNLFSNDTCMDMIKNLAGEPWP